MPAPVPVTITARFPLLGLELSTESGGILGYELDSDYTTSTDGWSLDIISADGIQYRAAFELQPIEILVNGHLQVTGRVDITEYGGQNGSALRLEGRDHMADLVECHVDPSLVIKKDMALGDALLLAFGPAGISGIVDDADVTMRNVRSGTSINAPTGKPFKDLKVGDLKPQPGQGMYDWGLRLAARHGATLQPGFNRHQVVLAAPNYDQDPSWGVVRRAGNPGARGNNVLRATARANYGSFPTYVLAVGKQRTTKDVEVTVVSASSKLATKKTVKKSSSMDVQAGFVDPDDLTQFAANFPPGFSDEELIHSGRIKPADGFKSSDALYRFHYIRDDQTKDGEEVGRIRLRHVAERMQQTLSYDITLRGHADPTTDALYAVDTVIDVDDEICNVRERLWVSSRTFVDQGKGPTTRLRCRRLGTFVI
jgi:hypothetical protein